MCPRHQRYVMRSHFQRMKSVFGFQACRRFKSTLPPSFFIVETPRNAKPSHSTRQHKALELPQLNHDLLNPFLLPRPQRKYLETNLLDNVKISTPGCPFPDPFRHFPRNTPPEMQAPPSSRQPHQNSTINGTISPPRTLGHLFRYVNRSSETPPFLHDV